MDRNTGSQTDLIAVVALSIIYQKNDEKLLRASHPSAHFRPAHLRFARSRAQRRLAQQRFSASRVIWMRCSWSNHLHPTTGVHRTGGSRRDRDGAPR